MNPRLLALLGAGLLACSATAAPVVPGFERFPASDRAGRLLLSELACIRCHKAEDSFPERSGPVLTEVGSRVRVGHLRKFLTEPHAVKPGTPMPDLLKGDKDKVEALVHLLASTGAPKHERAKGAAAGRDVYAKTG